MHYHSETLIRDLSARAQTFRIETLKMVYNAQSGHIGGAFSVAEILAALYFHHLKIDPARPDWPERDRLRFSKGHACAALYSALAYRGFFPVEELMTFRNLDSRLQGHPDRSKLPGIEVCSGPLGYGGGHRRSGHGRGAQHHRRAGRRGGRDDQRPCPVPLKRVGVPDRFAETGPYHAILDRYGLSIAHVVAAARAAVALKK